MDFSGLEFQFLDYVHKKGLGNQLKSPKGGFFPALVAAARSTSLVIGKISSAIEPRTSFGVIRLFVEETFYGADFGRASCAACLTVGSALFAAAS
jgi:hypothetical protein